MVKLHGGFHTDKATGTFNRNLTFSGWKGTRYGRVHVFGKQPRTTGQVEQRGRLSAGVDGWHSLLPCEREDWNNHAALLTPPAGPITGFNYFVQQYILQGGFPVLPLYPADGPGCVVGYWKFEGNCEDSSGEGNDGVNHGATYVDGKIGQALSFDGASNYVAVPNSPSLSITGEITVEAWIKRVHPQPGAWALIFSKGHPSAVRNLTIMILDNAKYHVGLGNGAVQYYPSVDVFFSTVWTHMVLTVDAAKVKVYKDGVLANEDNSQGLNVGTSALWLGRPVSGSHFYYDGALDEVKIYKRALSPGEVAREYERK